MPKMECFINFDLNQFITFEPKMTYYVWRFDGNDG